MASFNSLGTLSARVALDTTPLSAGMKTAGLLFAGIAAGAAAAIYKVGSSYQDSLNTFQAVSSASSEQMRLVGATAKTLGADMQLPATSAADAAKAMTELAKSGLSVEEAMAAAKGTLQLAAAAQTDEAYAAEVTANALNAFGLKGTEAGRVADILAASANASSAEITDMADALKMSSAVFAAAHIPLEDLSAALGELANKGIKGSDAGTSMKQMLLSLEGPSKKAAGVMRELGINIYDSNGNMKSLRDIIGNVSKSMAGLTEEQRNSALATIFGSDAVRAANIVLLGGVDAFDKMKEAVTKEGAAAEVARAKMKGLHGAWLGMVSQLETVAITIYEKVSPAIESLVRRLAAAVPDLVEKLKLGGKAFLAAFSGEGITSDGFVGVMERIGVAAKTVVDFIQDNWPRVRETLTNFASTVKPILDGIFTGIQISGPIAAGALAAVALAVEKLGQLLSENKPIVEAVAAIITTVLIPALTLVAIEAMASALKQAAAWVITHVQAIASAAIHVVQAAIVVGQWILMGATAMAQAAVIAAAWLISIGPIALVVAAVVGLAVIVVKNWDTIKGAVADGATWVKDHLTQIEVALVAVGGPLGALVVLFIEHFDKIKTVVREGVRLVANYFLSMAETVTSLAAKAFGWVPGVGPKLEAAARDVAGFRDRVNGALDGIRDKDIYINTYHRDIYQTMRTMDPYVGAMAEGGIVDGPTFALIGEAGRELVLPLTNMRRTFELLAQAGLVKPFAMPNSITRPGAVGAPTASSQPGGGPVVNLDIYPSADMDERQLGAIVAREIAWASGR